MVRWTCIHTLTCPHTHSYAHVTYAHPHTFTYAHPYTFTYAHPHEQAPHGCISCRKSLAALLVWLPILHGHLTCALYCMLHLNRDHFHLEFTKGAK